MIENLFLLLAGHATADFALQSDWMAKSKSRHSISPTYDPKLHGPLQTIWPYVLSSHALIHGAFVYLILGNIWLGLAETAAHFLIDFGKCERWFGIHTDQMAHIICKFIWLAIGWYTLS